MGRRLGRHAHATSPHRWLAAALDALRVGFEACPKSTHVARGGVHSFLNPGIAQGLLLPTRTYWVDLFVPPSTPPGTYEATLAVGPAGAARAEVEVEVVPVTLPRADHARLGAVNFGSLS